MINNDLKGTIRILKEASKKGGKPIWKAIANELDTAKRRRVVVNLSKINRHSETGFIAVPGKVLGSGTLTQPVNVAAFSFSKTAREKIILAKGKVLTLTELQELEIDPSKIRIIK